MEIKQFACFGLKGGCDTEHIPACNVIVGDSVLSDFQWWSVERVVLTSCKQPRTVLLVVRVGSEAKEMKLPTFFQVCIIKRK